MIILLFIILFTIKNRIIILIVKLYIGRNKIDLEKSKIYKIKNINL
jgi:hypothetical protein